jgi:hypothetical protein
MTAPATKVLFDRLAKNVNAADLTERHLLFIQLVIVQYFGVSNYDISVNNESRSITINIYDSLWKKVRISPKNPNFFTELSEYLGIPQYKIQISR